MNIIPLNLHENLFNERKLKIVNFLRIVCRGSCKTSNAATEPLDIGTPIYDMKLVYLSNN